MQMRLDVDVHIEQMQCRLASNALLKREISQAGLKRRLAMVGHTSYRPTHTHSHLLTHLLTHTLTHPSTHPLLIAHAGTHRLTHSRLTAHTSSGAEAARHLFGEIAEEV